MLPDNAIESSGALAGKFEVIKSVYKVHKDADFVPKPGQKPRLDQEGNPQVNEKLVALVLNVVPLNDDGERIEDAESRDLVLKLGAKSLATFHPGKGDSPDDMEPEDLGDELNTEGNTLYTSGGEVTMNAKSGYTVFMKSLQHRGFDKDRIGACWAPYFKGLKFELASVSPDKLEKYGQKKGEAGGIVFTYKVVEAIIAMPEAAKAKKDKKADKAEKAEPAPKAKTKAAKAADDDDDDDDAADNKAEVEAIRVLKSVVTRLAGKTRDFDKVRTFWVTMFSDPKVKGKEALKDAGRKLTSSDKWLASQLEDLDVVVDKDEKTATFPALADDDE